MSDELALRKKIEAAAKAKAILSDAGFMAAWQGVRDAVIQTWASSPVRDREGAHELRLMLKAMDDVHALLEVALEQGYFADKELSADKAQKTFVEKLKERLRIV